MSNHVKYSWRGLFEATMAAAALTAASFAGGCGGGEETAAPSPSAPTPSEPSPATVAATDETPPAAPPTSTLNGGGRFVLWSQASATAYESLNGRTFSAVGESRPEFAWAPWLAADSAGTLFLSSISAGPKVNRSTDATTWTPVVSADGDRASFALCAGAPNELFSVASDGRTYHSVDGGATWTERARLRPEGARGSGSGFGGSCAFDAARNRILAHAWYFDPAGPRLAVSEDDGVTWSDIPAPVERNDATTVLWAGDAIVYAGYDRVWRTEDRGATWSEATPAPLYATGATGHGYNRWYASDGANVVVGVEAPGSSTQGAIFVSTDAARTFEVLPFVYDSDPTPGTSDETVRVAFVLPGS